MEESNPIRSISLGSPYPCRIVKWIAECGDRVRKGAVLLTYASTESSSAETDDELPLKATLVGVVKERLVAEGEIVQPG